jgi:hypothetical protein
MEKLIRECGLVKRDFISFYSSPKETTESSQFRAYHKPEGRDGMLRLA